MRVLIAAAFLALLSQAQQQQPAPQQPPVIRSRITMVPVDVRVVDQDGKPIVDLTQEDFTILEDGVRHPIKLFSSHTFASEPDAADEPPALRRPSEALASTRTSNRRVFLLNIGRGRHQAVSKYIDGLSEFTGRLLPQDQIAVKVWNRATPFTTDRARVQRLLARYAERHERIETMLREWFSGLRAVYGSKEIPPHIQREIDAVFVDAGMTPRTLTVTMDADARQRAAGERAAEIQRDALIKERPAGETLPDLQAAQLSQLAGMDYEQFIAQSSETLQDLGGLYASIEYLRYLDGEKHVVFITERGVDLPLFAGNTHLARIASDARVAFSVVQTGGAPAPPLAKTHVGNIYMEAMPSFMATSNQTFAIQDLRMIAEDTGGQLMAYKHARDAFSRLHDALGHQYLLAYEPVNSVLDGKARRIEVRVNRRGARVLHRSAYFASPETVPASRREFITYSRIRAAARYGGDIKDIGVAVRRVSLAGGPVRALTVDLAVDITRVAFRDRDGQRTAFLDIGVFALDQDRESAGEVVQQIPVSLSPAAYDRARKDRLVVSVRVPLTRSPIRLRAVVYDYVNDLLGTVRGDLQ